MTDGVTEVARRVIRIATERGLRIASAESLTGGLLAAALVDAPGASRAFTGGAVTYDTELKRSLLGVDAGLLIDRGPVDPEVARQMARGVRRVCAIPGENDESREADIGVATTGVAGPEPDPQTGQPVGTVWVGVSSRLGDRAVRLHLGGERAAIRSSTVRAALEELVRELDGI